MNKNSALAVILSLWATCVRAEGGSAMAGLLKEAGAEAPPAVAAVQGTPAPAAPATAVKTELVRFAKCKATVDGIALELDFLREEQAGKPTGKGVMNQVMPGIGVIPLTMTILADDQQGTKVELFAALDPTVKFAEFTIPRTPKSKVMIYAIQFRAEWLTADCVR